MIDVANDYYDNLRSYNGFCYEHLNEEELVGLVKEPEEAVEYLENFEVNRMSLKHLDVYVTLKRLLTLVKVQR